MLTDTKANLRIKDPILDTPIRLLGRFLGLLPSFLNFVDEPGLLFGLFQVDLVPLLGQVILELLRVPLRVGDYYFDVPVLLDNVFKVLSARRFGIR